MIDDVIADLGQAVDVGLAGAKIAALDGVVEKPPDAVAVVGIVLGGIDAALGGDAVGAARAVLETEGLYVVAQFGQGGGGRSAGQTGAHHDDVEFAFVGGIDQFEFETVAIPFLLEIGPAGTLPSSIIDVSFLAIESMR
jgi:hypothetical protein